MRVWDFRQWFLVAVPFFVASKPSIWTTLPLREKTDSPNVWKLGAKAVIFIQKSYKCKFIVSYIMSMCIYIYIYVFYVCLNTSFKKDCFLLTLTFQLPTLDPMSGFFSCETKNRQKPAFWPRLPLISPTQVTFHSPSPEHASILSIYIYINVHSKRDTLPETNIAPENGGFQ